MLKNLKQRIRTFSTLPFITVPLAGWQRLMSGKRVVGQTEDDFDHVAASRRADHGTTQDNGKLQSSRFEFKYLVEPNKAPKLRDFVRQYLKPDAYTDPITGEGYPVHSLYLDSRNLRLCRQTICGEKNRFKLRIRFYDDSETSPVFLEIKRRVLDCIQKQRVAILRTALPDLFAGYRPSREFLVADNPRNYGTLTNFCELSREVDALPAAYTSYLREAYESPSGNAYRVTFDRELRAGRFTGTLNLADLANWPLAPMGGVIFELKFTDRFPQWMRDLVEMFQLQRISVPKYVECMDVVERNRVKGAGGTPRIILDTPLRIKHPVRRGV